jgi:hypothetical protein
MTNNAQIGEHSYSCMSNIVTTCELAIGRQVVATMQVCAEAERERERQRQRESLNI